MNDIVYGRHLEIYDTADIIVAGGGPAGVAAAVCAARKGKKVILSEQSGTLGGSSTLAMVAELMNFDDGEHFISGGIGKEIFDKLHYTCRYGRQWYNVRYEQMKCVYDELVQDSGVQVMFYTRLVDVICKDGEVKYAIFSGPDGLFAMEGKFFIDCTGNGSLSCFAGADYAYGDAEGKTMSATICSLWGGVDFTKKALEPDYTNIGKAYDDGVFSQYDTVLPGIKENYPELSVGGGNVGHCFGVDDRDVRSLTNAMFQGRKVLKEFENYYRGYVSGCENATLIKSADYIGIRESRRILCEYTLTADSFFDQGSFEDEIGRYSYPVDIHPMAANREKMVDFSKSVSICHKPGETYSIPYRCLVPKNIKNVLVAGRCIGTDRSMQASVRVIPCCYITGQATGIAAALCVEENVNAKDVDVAKLRSELRAAGAYLGR